MRNLIREGKLFYKQCRAEDFGFYMAAAYIIFSYLRPQAIIPGLDIIPWTQLCILAGIAWAATKHTLKFQYAHIVVLLFCLSCLLSAFLSQYREASLEKIDVVFIWLLELLFFTSCVNSLNKLRLILILFFLVLFKISFFGARTWVQRGFGFADYGISGPSGYFANSGELSLLMAMLGIMSLSVILGNDKVRRFYLVLPITAYMTVLAASSRGAQLALLIGTTIFFFSRKQIKIRSILIVLAIGILGYAALPAEQKERMMASGSDSTSQSRLLYWSSGMDMWQKHPITGVGYRCFPRYFHDHYAGLIPEGVAWGKRREVAHNTYIEVLSETGILGTWFYLWMCLLVFKLNRSSRRAMNKTGGKGTESWYYQFTIGMDIAQLVFLIGATFMSVALYPYVYFMLMLSTSLNNSVQFEARKLQNISTKGQAIARS